MPLIAIRDASDDPIALPTVGHGRALFVVARIDQQMPVRVLLGEVCDTANDAAAPAGLGFDQHRNVLNAKLTLTVVCVTGHRNWIALSQPIRVVDKLTAKRVRFSRLHPILTRNRCDCAQKRDMPSDNSTFIMAFFRDARHRVKSRFRANWVFQAIFAPSGRLPIQPIIRSGLTN